MAVAETSAAPVTEAPRAPGGPIIGGVLRSELTKLRTVRSTYWTLFTAVVAIVGLGAFLCAEYVGHYAHIRPEEKGNFDPTSFSLNGLLLAQLAVGVLGVLLITSEYSTGMIRATLAAVPQRRTVLAAKALVFIAVTVVLGVAACFAAFLIGQSILSSKHIEASLGDPGVLRAVIGGGLYLTVLGLLALGLGTLIRHSAGAIAALFGLVLVLPGSPARFRSPGRTRSTSICRATPDSRSSASVSTHTRSRRGRGSASSASTRRSHSPRRRSC